MTEDADPEANLREWKEAMRAEHDDAIENPQLGVLISARTRIATT